MKKRVSVQVLQSGFLALFIFSEKFEKNLFLIFAQLPPPTSFRKGGFNKGAEWEKRVSIEEIFIIIAIINNKIILEM